MSGEQSPPASEATTPRPAAPARLLKRTDFLAAAKGRRLHVSDFSLQAAPRAAAQQAGTARVGLTVTRKEGGAVARNRMRRRFREALRTMPGLPLAPGTDYVIVARRASLAIDFASLRNALAGALERILKERPRGGGQNRRGGADTTRPRTP